MFDTTKTKETDKLHRAIWSIAEKLRGTLDGWDFKNYVLYSMFYQYLSENLRSYINEKKQDTTGTFFDYANLSDMDADKIRDRVVQAKGFFILPSELFCNVNGRAEYDKNLSKTLQCIFSHIEESTKGSQAESSFAGLFAAFDVDSKKLGATVEKRNETLVKLLHGIADMDLIKIRKHNIDIFGEAYDYLMTMYASDAGKSGGEYFTPPDVSKLLVRLGIAGKQEIYKVYDPACGSGSLLLAVDEVLGKGTVRYGYFGQDSNITAYNLCRINMILHDVGFSRFDIRCEDTLTSPQHWTEQPFDLIVSNPPYSIQWDGYDNPLLVNDPRFTPAGALAPKHKADFAFIMHALSWLSKEGTAVIVCFPGILYRGREEQKIRKYLIDNNYIDCIIQLPGNLFFGTPVATCIMIIRKNKTDSNTLFIDASNDCQKVTNHNKLTDTNIDNIVKLFADRTTIAHDSYLASYDDIKKRNYNLSVSNYVKKENSLKDIDITKLNSDINNIILREKMLRKQIAQAITDYDSISDRLIHQFCPNGVEYKKLKEILTIKHGKDYKHLSEGNVPVYGTGGIVAHVDSYMYDKPSVLIPRKGSLYNLYYVTEPFWIIDTIFYTDVDCSQVLPRYVYFCLEMMHLENYSTSGGVPSLTQSVLYQIEIPVPPLEAQRELVRILDTFTSLSKELTDEISIRKQQYEYYRNKFLSFDKK